MPVEEKELEIKHLPQWEYCRNSDIKLEDNHSGKENGPCLIHVGFAMFPAALQPWVKPQLIVIDDDAPVLLVLVSRDTV